MRLCYERTGYLAKVPKDPWCLGCPLAASNVGTVARPDIQIGAAEVHAGVVLVVMRGLTPMYAAWVTRSPRGEMTTREVGQHVSVELPGRVAAEIVTIQG